jgi:hypothetical protein
MENSTDKTETQPEKC